MLKYCILIEYGWNGRTDKDAYDNVHPIVFGEVKSNQIQMEKLFYSITITTYNLRIRLSYGMRIRLVEKLKAITSLGTWLCR